MKGASYGKYIAIHIFITTLSSNSLTLAMRSLAKSGAENKAYILKNNRIIISDEELQQVEDLENVQVQDGDTRKSLHALHVLYLHSNQLASMPAELGNLTNLQTLNLNDNQLTSVPAELGNLINLQMLWLHNNQLTSVPAELGNLSSLQSLVLSNNQLTSVPAEIGSLTNLLGLGLHNNQLTSVPVELGNLINLDGLALYHNQLISIPAEIADLSNLTVLWLASNRLESLPPAFARLKKLEMVNLMDNAFGKHIVSKNNKKRDVASSVPFMLFKLAGQKILRTAKQLLKVESYPLILGFKKLTEEGLMIVKGQDIFKVLAFIERNLPSIESSINETSESDESKKSLQLLTTLKDHVKLYQWLCNLILSNKIFIGNAVNSPKWCFEGNTVKTGCRDVRNMILSLWHRMFLR